MIIRRMLILTAVLVVLVAVGAAAGDRRQAAGEPVTLAAVVVDRDGAPVRDLRPGDFRVTENGKPVVVTEFDTVATGASIARGRAVVLVLGSVGIVPAFTPRAQSIARRFLEAAGTADRVSVVRMASRDDEIAGSRETMLARVEGFRAPMGESLHRKTNMDVLDLVARLSRDLRDVETARRAVVFIGAPSVYDVPSPLQQQAELVWPNWVGALTEAARSNVSVYVIDPHGVNGSVRINSDGLVAQTGGAVFDNVNDTEGAMASVWRDIRSYYALEYVPERSSREIQKISVKVTRPGLSVHARRSR